MSVPAIPPVARRALHRTVASALALATSLAWSQTLSPASAVARVGTFKQVQGQIRVGQQTDRPAPQPGDALRAGERVVTGQDGAASLVLADGTALTLGPNTTADLSQFQFDATTQEGNLLLELLQGSVRVVTGLLGRLHPDRFQVKTPTAVVGVRGTDFIVEAIPQPQSLHGYVTHHWRDHSRLRK